MRVLVGDIGGTKTHLAVVEIDAERIAVQAERRYPSRDFPGLAPIVAGFLAEVPAAQGTARACFGIAGPVINNRCEATNLPWFVDGDALGRELALGPTLLVNDFVAAAYGVLRLAPSDLIELNPGVRVPRAPIGILGAGTGLGEASLVWTGARYQVVPSEGGHGDFAPRDELQIGLLRYLLARRRRVSYERVCSGMGLANIYAYLRDTGVAPEDPAVRAALDAGADLGATIGPRAVADSDPLSRATIDLFVRVYGAEAGNVALRGITRGGVFLAGGIAGKILPRMTDGVFRAAYVDKGRLADMVEQIPVYIAAHPHLALFGAAHAAEAGP